MTQILEKAWNKVINLPEAQQDSIAHIIMDAINDDELWDKQFLSTQDKLSILAEKVRNDIKDGKVKNIGFGEL
jgi:hypothetical protein